jgi:hypothetical protein
MDVEVCARVLYETCLIDEANSFSRRRKMIPMCAQGGTNHHPGNKLYRKMVEERKINYVNCKRLDKPLVALGIIREWRSQTPPGRFLKMDEKTGLWNDVGDKKAREKTSQALRERAPQIRQEIEKERVAKVKKIQGESSEDDDVRCRCFGDVLPSSSTAI